MSKTNKYPIEKFYVGELYLYKLFAGLSNGETIANGEKRIEELSTSSAICFQQDEESRYIDWDNKREYIGFLTIFYREGKNYVCLHNGKTYQLNGPIIIDGLTPLSDLLPTIDTKSRRYITMYEGLYLFDILFDQRENQLYLGKEFPKKNFYVGDLILPTRKTIIQSDQRIRYKDLPQNLMLSKADLEIKNYIDDGIEYSVYRSLFLQDGVDLYNPYNNQYYNPNEDRIDNIVPFVEYIGFSGEPHCNHSITI